MALSGTLILVPVLLLAHNWAPAAARLKAGPGPGLAAPATPPSTAPVASAPTATSAVSVVPATTPPPASIVLTPAVALLPTTSSTTWRVIPRTTTTVRRVVVTAPPAPRPPPPTTLPRPPAPVPPAYSETGQASWYVAPAGFCAHPTLPIGTVITVTDLATGAKATCTVEGRGPFGGGGRIVDLDQTTFAKLAPLAQGVINVRISW